MTNRNSDRSDDTPATHSISTGETVELHPAIIKWALGIGLAVAIAVTASSFKLSFATLYDLGIMANMGDSAWVIPVVLDGPILAASILRVALSQHTDRRTVIGRWFCIAVYTLTGLASMAGNAYHAILTVTDLNAGVAAALGALAPLMVMTMCEMMSIGISAPRRRTNEGERSTSVVDEFDPPSLAAEASVDDGTDELVALLDEHGTLEPEVWQTADLYQNDPDTKGNFAAVSRRLGVKPPTIARRYDKYSALINKVTAIKADEKQGIHTRRPNWKQKRPGIPKVCGRSTTQVRADDTATSHQDPCGTYRGSRSGVRRPRLRRRVGPQHSRQLDLHQRCALLPLSIERSPGRSSPRQRAIGIQPDGGAPA